MKGMPFLKCCLWLIQIKEEVLMKKLLSVLSASAIALTTAYASGLFTPAPETIAKAAGSVSIMPIGDSITEGMGEDGGYRKYLDYTLNQKGIDHDMVGLKKDARTTFTYNGQSVQYDGDHAGYSGFQIKQVPDWGKSQGNTGSLYNELKNNDAVKKCKPDIVLLIIGTNDMTANRSMSDCSNDLHDLVDYILADMPSGGKVFMGSIPEFTMYGGNPEKIANYNNTVKSVAESYGDNVQFADVHGCLDGMNDIGNDNLHPNGGGYEKIGKFWADQIADYLGSGSSGSDEPGDDPPSNPPSDPPALSGDELLVADFENGLSGWTNRGTATVETTKQDAASGSQSASVTARGNDWAGIAYDISSLCPAGTVFDISAKIKQSSGSAVKFKLTVQYGSGNDVDYDTFAEGSIASGEWGTLSATEYTVKSGSNPLLYIETDTSKCDFCVDDIIITKTAGAKQPANYKVGDVDGNGTINAVDLSLAKQAANDKLTDSTQKKMADVNYDRVVDATDIEWFVKYLTCQTNEFPEKVAPQKGEMRPISEYTPVAEAALTGMNYDILNSNAGTQYGEVKKEYYRSKAANKDKPYNILLPANYDPSKEYPVLYILHGYYENEDRMMITGNNNEAMKTKELVGNLIAQGKAEEMIVVSPFVFTSATMNGPSGMDNQSNAAYDAFVDDIVDSLMPHIESKYSVATGRENTAVTGFSMGGRESLQIGMKYGDKFGYVGACCPAPGTSGAWKWNSEEETPSLVYITAGTADDVVGVSIPEGYHNNFTDNNVPHLWQIVQGGHHGDDSIRTHLYNFVQFVFKA